MIRRGRGALTCRGEATEADQYDHKKASGLGTGGSLRIGNKN